MVTYSSAIWPKIPNAGIGVAENSPINRFRKFRRRIVGRLLGGPVARRGSRNHPVRGAHPVADLGHCRFGKPFLDAPLLHVSFKSCLVRHRGTRNHSAEEFGREIGPSVFRSPTPASHGARSGVSLAGAQVRRVGGLRLLVGSRARNRFWNRDRGRVPPKLSEQITIMNSQFIIAFFIPNEERRALVLVEIEFCLG